MSQPPPTPGKADVAPVTREVLNSALDAAVARGMATYGTPLQSHNGRDAYADAIEELVDAAQYLTQARMEHADLVERAEKAEEKVSSLKFGIRAIMDAYRTNHKDLIYLLCETALKVNE
jgi:hypothetical protein